MTKNEFKNIMLSKGIKFGYSGKKKIFFVEEYPDENTIIEITKSGFKIFPTLNFVSLTKEEVEAARPKDAYDYIF